MDTNKGKSDISKENNENDNANQPLSQTISNAHAAGDGSLGRGKDTVMNVDDEEEKEVKDENEQSKDAADY